MNSTPVNDVPSSPKLSEEEDDDDDDPNKPLAYGWDYNDAFDNPDEEEEPEVLDEDELYARGLDKDKKNEND